MANVNSLIVIGLWITLILSIAIGCKALWPNQGELSRKVVHIGTGPVIPLAWWLDVPARVAIPLALVITIGLLMNHHLRFVPAIEDVNRKSYGTITYGLAITALFVFYWPENAAAVCAGTLIMAFGDGLAGLIGPQIKSPSWKIFNQRKSIAGTLTMAIVSMSVLILISVTIGIPLQPAKLCVLTGIAVGLEQISGWGNTRV
mgnify:CR=1 FL=1